MCSTSCVRCERCPFIAVDCFVRERRKKGSDTIIESVSNASILCSFSCFKQRSQSGMPFDNFCLNTYF
ncbi:unnamed protein product [Gongylonema pulchrum]|uniref:Secreted protein n=1 Tax=Gongylonema pulchrum TaxID=637853 RepID=A0A183E936_9BILA|nr:unnamed protein product [Gongylonema pulchrum]